MSNVFISYNRCSRPYAKCLYWDLQRFGLDVWLDLRDIPPGKDFESVIVPEISQRSHVVLLATPESNASEWVQKEFRIATNQGKTVIPLRLVGPPESMCPEWEKLNMIESAATDYWGCVRELTSSLSSPNPMKKSPVELMNLKTHTVEQVETEFQNSERHTLYDGRELVKIPLWPSAYGMISLYAPRAAKMQWPDDLAILFTHTSESPGTRHTQALENWAEQVPEPWMILVEGPVNPHTNRYEVAAEKTHIWKDCFNAGRKAVEELLKKALRIGFYFNSLLPLMFEIALCSTMVSKRRRVYHFDMSPSAGPARYQTAFDGW